LPLPATALMIAEPELFWMKEKMADWYGEGIIMRLL